MVYREARNFEKVCVYMFVFTTASIEGVSSVSKRYVRECQYV